MSVPIYQDGMVTIYCGDAACMEEVADASVQLIVTSPPYNVERDYGVEDRRPLEAYLALLDAWLGEMYRALRPGGVLALNIASDISLKVTPSGKWVKHMRTHDKRKNIASIHGRWSCFPIAAWVQMQALEIGYLPRRSVVWVKSAREGTAYATSLAMGNVANPFLRPCHEEILLFSKETYTRPGTDGRIHPRERFDWLKDVWHITAYTRRTSFQCKGKGHPCPFPAKLPSRLILLFTEPGDLVLDPFVGSGTTLRVAKKLGRPSIGYDVVEKWCRLAADNCRQGVLPLSSQREGW